MIKIDQLENWINRNQGGRRSRGERNRAMFMAIRNDVKNVLEAGYAVKTVWAYLRDTNGLPFGYETFLKYVTQQKFETHTSSSAMSPLLFNSEQRRTAVESDPDEIQTRSDDLKKKMTALSTRSPDLG